MGATEGADGLGGGGGSPYIGNLNQYQVPAIEGNDQQLVMINSCWHLKAMF